ncbi:SpoIIE family protein phosphatase, partial [bacterium]|nr:SpoIIE family protein phosphatase [bacterium]
VKVGQILPLLFLGLFAFLYILASTVADLYHITNPAIGVSTAVSRDSGKLLVVNVVPEGPAERSGILTEDEIKEVSGRPVTSVEDFTTLVEEVGIGEHVELTISREGQTFKKDVPTKRLLSIYTQVVFLSLLPGVLFSYALILIGTFVFLKKIEDRTAHIFYMMVLCWALAMWESFPFGFHQLRNILPDWFEWVTLTFWPLAVGLLLHFTMIFPLENKSFQKHPKPILAFAYFPLFFVLVFIYADVQGASWTQHVLRIGWGVFFSAIFYCAMHTLGKSSGHKENPLAAKQAQIMLMGTNLSLLVPVGYYYIPKMLFDWSLPFSDYVLFLCVFWPITLAYVIVRHRFMEIDVIIKRGVAYALLSGFVVAVYFLLVVGVGQLVLNLTGSRSQIVTIIATLFIAALFNPVKSRIRNFVDRRFYPNRFTYRESVRDFSHQLVNVVDLDRLLDLVRSFLADTMRVRPVAVFWNNGNSEFYPIQASDDPVSADLAFSTGDVVISAMQKKKKLLDLTPLREQETEISDEEVRKWESLSSEIVLPLLAKGKLLGAISLGPKGQDEPYYKEDIDLLETLNDQINISLENAILTEKLREQDRLRKELEVARRIQLNSLPQTDPHVTGLDVSGVSIPALEVGGDYYDYLDFSDGRFGVVVGDVSGKGTSAALYMSQLKGVLQTAAKFYKSLKDLMVEVNSVTYRSIEQKSFITLTCGAFDLRQQKFQLVRAGHLPIVHYCAKKRACTELTPQGIGVGLENGKIFDRALEEVEVTFSAGDIFLFYTDGIDEARNAKGEQLDITTISGLIGSNDHKTALELREQILSEVVASHDNTAQKDDMTLVVVRVR